MANEMTYKDIFKDRQYRKILFSNLINRFGDSIDAIAFTWLIYQITQSASWAALIYGLNRLPNIVLQPFLGPIVEKTDKKKVIVSSHIIRGITIAVFAFMYIAGMVTPYILTAFTILITTIESFNLPASTAIIPLVVKKEKLAHAISLNSCLSNVATLIGTGLSGVILANLGVQFAMLVDVSTFFLAALIILPLKTNQSSADSNAPKAAEQNSYFSLLKDGIKYLLGNHIIMNICFIALLMNFFLVPLNALEAPIAEEIYGLGSGILSVMGMAGAIGGIFGAVIIPKIIAKLSVKKVLVYGGSAMGIFMFILSLGGYFKGMLVPGYLLAGISFFMMATAASVLNGTIDIQFGKNCEKEYLARVGSVIGAISITAMPIGSFIISFLSINISTSVLLASYGIMFTILMILVFISNMDFETKEKDVENETKTI
ncbi:MAG: MFS transporter [Butyrivibrio sp.]|nr:MFS transporter [Butyrivibrio sp.]